MALGVDEGRRARSPVTLDKLLSNDLSEWDATSSTAATRSATPPFLLEAPPERDGPGLGLGCAVYAAGTLVALRAWSDVADPVGRRRGLLTNALYNGAHRADQANHPSPRSPPRCRVSLEEARPGEVRALAAARRQAAWAPTVDSRSARSSPRSCFGSACGRCFAQGPRPRARPPPAAGRARPLPPASGAAFRTSSFKAVRSGKPRGHRPFMDITSKPSGRAPRGGQVVQHLSWNGRHGHERNGNEWKNRRRRKKPTPGRALRHPGHGHQWAAAFGPRLIKKAAGPGGRASITMGLGGCAPSPRGACRGWLRFLDRPAARKGLLGRLRSAARPRWSKQNHGDLRLPRRWRGALRSSTLRVQKCDGEGRAGKRSSSAPGAARPPSRRVQCGRGDGVRRSGAAPTWSWLAAKAAAPGRARGNSGPEGTGPGRATGADRDARRGKLRSPGSIFENGRVVRIDRNVMDAARARTRKWAYMGRLGCVAHGVLLVCAAKARSSTPSQEKSHMKKANR